MDRRRKRQRRRDAERKGVTGRGTRGEGPKSSKKSEIVREAKRYRTRGDLKGRKRKSVAFCIPVGEISFSNVFLVFVV